jgi:uncharacterized protein involved in exopolysaccharide biosynthesis
MNELQQTGPESAYDDETDLRELFRILWKGKWLIGSITFASAVIAVIVALLLPNIYRAEALLAPNDQEGAGGLSTLAAQYGGLASLAGFDLGTRSSDKISLGLEILKSRKFVSEFIERHDILVPLMAAKKWDAETGQLIINPDIYDMVVQKWVRNVDPPKKAVPSSQEAYENFMEKISVSQDKQSGFVTVSVEHFSPQIAKQWVDWLISDLNSSIMRQDVAEAEQAIQYLNEQILNTSLAQLKNVFFSLIEEQTKTVMLAKVTDEYLLKTVDPAITPEKKYRPSRSLIVLLCTVLGGFISVLFVLVLRAIESPIR